MILEGKFVWYGQDQVITVLEDYVNVNILDYPMNVVQEVCDIMPEYLKKVYEFFKTNNTAKDVLIGSVSFIAGGFVLDRILRRDEDQDEQPSN